MSQNERFIMDEEIKLKPIPYPLKGYPKSLERDNKNRVEEEKE